MKASIHNPYLDTLGGGEKYTAGVIKTLLKTGYRVDLEWNDSSIVGKLEQRFGVKLPGVNVVEDIKRGDGYDLCFWVSDGSIPTLRARKNLLHFQVPFHNIGGNNLLNKMKLFRVDHIVCNSEFTKRIVDQEYGVESVVVYPPVDLEKIKPKRKENLIIYVGRFSKLVQAKGQEIVVDAFNKFISDQNYKNWNMVLAGGTEVGVDDELKTLKEMAKGANIDFLENPKYSDLLDLYGKARFFWSASGYGVDQDLHPDKLEHFGITTVEAMAAGAIPVVFKGGGQVEIVKDGVNGILWSEPDSLIVETKMLIDDKSRFTTISKEAVLSAKKYSSLEFEKKITSLL